jgi:hypothetical protein
LDRAGLSDERRPKVRHDPVRLHKLLPGYVRLFGIVFSVLIVRSERDSGCYLIGLADDVFRRELSSAENVSPSTSATGLAANGTAS